MKWVLFVGLLLIALLVLIIITKIKVVFRYQHAHTNDELVLKLSAWFGLLRYTVKVPVIQVDADSASVKVKEEQGTSDETKQEENMRFTPKELIHFLQDIKSMLEHVVNFHKIVRKFLRKVQVKQFEWCSVVGMGDAAHTGVAVGGCWTLKSAIIGLLTNYLHFRVMPIYSITPDFQNHRAEIYISCIFQFRIGQAILTGIKMLRYWKGSKVKFKSKTLAKLTNNSNKQSM